MKKQASLKDLRRRRRKLDNFFNVLLTIGIVLLFLLPITGPIISGVQQAIIQQATYGAVTKHIHIWGLYDLWNLTLLGYIPLYFIFLT